MSVMNNPLPPHIHHVGLDAHRMNLDDLRVAVQSETSCNTDHDVTKIYLEQQGIHLPSRNGETAHLISLRFERNNEPRNMISRIAHSMSLGRELQSMGAKGMVGDCIRESVLQRAEYEASQLPIHNDGMRHLAEMNIALTLAKSDELKQAMKTHLDWDMRMDKVHAESDKDGVALDFPDVKNNHHALRANQIVSFALEVQRYLDSRPVGPHINANLNV